MEERRTEESGVGGTDLNREESAGRANMPSFDQEDDEMTAESGRPPSHREFQEENLGAEGQQGGQEALEGIAARGEELGERARDTARQVEDRVGDSLDRAGRNLEGKKDRTADAIEGAAERIHDTASRYEREGGLRGSAAGVVHRAGEAGERAASFIRDAEMDDVRGMLERQVRDRPLQTLAIAAAAGWLLGKIIR